MDGWITGVWASVNGYHSAVIDACNALDVFVLFHVRFSNFSSELLRSTVLFSRKVLNFSPGITAEYDSVDTQVRRSFSSRSRKSDLSEGHIEGHIETEQN